MKIVMLDIDGVLNSVRSVIARSKGRDRPTNITHKTFEERSLDVVAVNLLRRLCESTDAKIVISSTWRQGRTKEDFVNIFAYYGWHDFPIIGATPKLNTIRGNEIANWISSYTELNQSDPIEQYVILDDDSDMLPEQKNNFVHVDLRDGLLLRDYVKALKILDPQHPDLSPMSLGAYLEESDS